MKGAHLVETQGNGKFTIPVHNHLNPALMKSLDIWADKIIITWNDGTSSIFITLPEDVQEGEQEGVQEDVV